MEPLSKVQDFINTEVANGNTSNIIIDLDNYENPSSTFEIIVPWNVSSITFKQSPSNTTVYNMNVVIEENYIQGRVNLEMTIENFKINSGEYPSIDFRATWTFPYTSVLKFKGLNYIKSEKNIGICINHNQTINISGESPSDVLEVYGGTLDKGLAAIGNHELYSFLYGGHIILSGYGIIKAYGGDGGGTDNAITDPQVGKNGGIAIGFVPETLSNSSVTIIGNINVLAYGGDGQNVEVNDISYNISAGNGGAGISVGSGGIISHTSTGILEVYGGTGGYVKDCFNEGSAGDGGSAIYAHSGKVELLNGGSLYGGNGGTGIYSDDPDNVLGVKGGSGGNTIDVFNENPVSSENYVHLVNTTLTSGSGGDSGSFIDFDTGEVIGFNGLDGGALVNVGSIYPATVIIENISGTSGNGGKGGYSYSDTATSGNGGNSGSGIIGHTVRLNNYSQPDWFTAGEPGTAGISETSSGSSNPGESGRKGESIIIINRLKTVLKFTNLSQSFNIMFKSIQNSSPDVMPMLRMFNRSITPQENERILNFNNAPLYINQKFNAGIRLDDLNIQANYNSADPTIFGEAVISLVYRILVYEYEKFGMNIFFKN